MKKWFSGKRRSRGREEMDPNLPPLTRHAADDLRNNLARNISEHGALVRFQGERAVVTHTQRGVMNVSLSTLARDVAASEHPKASQQLARVFVDAVFSEPLASDMDTAQLYRSLRLRLAPQADSSRSADAQSIIDGGTVSRFTDDTVVTLALDSATAVQTLPLERLEAYDDVDTLVRAAENNLRTELESSHLDIQLNASKEDHPGAHFWSVESDSIYTASAALVLDPLLQTWLPDVDFSEGVLFAMPSRHSLLVRPVTEGEDLLEGITRLAPVALEVSHRATHPVSSLLHVSHLGQVDTISQWDGEKRHLTITPTPHLLSRMRI